ncbi:MAG: hypothetical protein KF836_04095 [Fimbriimonadaceae bacterium]|nr:hypothetical protein [Fimbriimonadaceae bacterium]
MNNQPKRTLPRHPHLDHLRAEAKSLLKSWQSGESQPPGEPKLTLAQYVLAQEYGFESWPKLHAHVEKLTMDRLDSATWLNRVVNSPHRDPHPHYQSNWWLALAAGDADTVRKLLGNHKADEPGGPLNWYPINYVCNLYVNSFDPSNTVKILLDAGADPNTQYIHPDYPNEPMSALWGACRIKQDIETVRILLEVGMTPNDHESLYHTVEIDRPDILQLLIDYGVEEKGSNGLLRSLDFERPLQIKMVLDNGADPNGTMGEGALHHAIRRGRSPEILQILVDAGANLKAFSKERLTLLTHASLRGAPGVYEWAVQVTGESVDDPLQNYVHAVRSGNQEKAQEILAQHPNLPSKFAPIHLALPCQAIMSGETESAKMMLTSGWPVQSPDDGSATGSRGASPLHTAVYVGNLELVDFIIALGGDVNYVEPGYNATPLGWAVHSSMFGNYGGDLVGCIRSLRKAGAKVEEGDSSNWPDEIYEAMTEPID